MSAEKPGLYLFSTIKLNSNNALEVVAGVRIVSTRKSGVYIYFLQQITTKKLYKEGKIQAPC